MNPPQGPQGTAQDRYPGFDDLELELSVQFAEMGHTYFFARQLALDMRLALEVHTPQCIVVTGIGS